MSPTHSFGGAPRRTATLAGPKMKIFLGGLSIMSLLSSANFYAQTPRSCIAATVSRTKTGQAGDICFVMDVSPIPAPSATVVDGNIFHMDAQ